MATVLFTPRSATTRRGVLLIGALLLALTAALTGVLTAGAAPAARPAAAPAAVPAGQAVTTTATITGNANLPTPVNTGAPALPVQTADTAAPVGTSGPAGVAPGAGDTTTGGQPAPTPAPTGTAGSSSPPWLWIIAGLVLLGIAAAAAYLFTRRPPAPVAAPAEPAPPPVAPPADVARVSPPPAALPVAPAPAPAVVEARPAAPHAAPAPVAAPAATAATMAPLVTAPTMVKCPNCDTMNPIDRRYCDECGQDLRSAVAAAMAGTLPEVEATTPYLETLSRADEQLEFVLARDVITVGRGLDNDIVIDDQFIGWQTVSPRHAELRRGPNGFVLRDLNSENGTFVNSSRTGENVLEDGMTIALGKVEFIYRVPTE
jgi:FHA domain-containing protein